MKILKRGFLMISAVCIMAASAQAQIIENSVKPHAADAGRVVTPRLVWTIKDDGEKFFFKYPWGLHIAPDGSIFVRDKEQVLQFDQDGKFQRNLFKKGQGPGELLNAGGVAFRDGNIVLLSTNPKKLIWLDAAGRHVRDIVPPPKFPFLRPLGWIDGRWMYERSEVPHHQGESAYIERPSTLLAWDEKATDYTSLASFNVMIYAVTSRGGYRGMFTYAPFICVPYGDHRLAVVHTAEYLIKIHDIRADITTRQFRRVYQRVPPLPLEPGEERPQISLGGEVIEEPARKFDNDITSLLVRGDRLWVVTSTREKSKGQFIDVFDEQGIYQDAFFLGLSGAGQNALRSNSTCSIAGDFLWTIERTPEDTFQIKKYALK